MIGTIALSPSSGSRPGLRDRRRACGRRCREAGEPRRIVAERRRSRLARHRPPTAAARSRRAARASAARARRTARGSPRRSLRPRRPSALPSVPVSTMSSRPSRPKRSSTPRPRLADHADAVRVVDDQGGVVLGGEVRELGHQREVALHAEDAVGDDQPALDVGRFLQHPAQVVHVRVLEHGLVRGPREAHAVDDRGVVQAVGEDRRRHVAKRVEERGVRVPARDVGEGRGRLEELGEVVARARRGARTCRR